jgi:hypothetical protein
MPTPIKYIGHRPVYKDGCYGTKAEFEKGQTRMVADEVARKMLRHPDVYVLGEAPATKESEVPEPGDRSGTEQVDLQEAIDSLRTMNRVSLKQFAQTHFRVELPDVAVGEMRDRVRTMVEQYGLT